MIEVYVKEYGSFVLVEYIKSIPPVYNNENECIEAELLLRGLIGDNLISVHKETPLHGVDDFSCFQNRLSGLFFFLGAVNLKKGIMALTHTPKFDLDEDCLTFCSQNNVIFYM